MIYGFILIFLQNGALRKASFFLFYTVLHGENVIINLQLTYIDFWNLHNL